eukprot:TRINITY_DN3733_c0_g1_i2.p1 TRINITY_DN3733_c0_g1~~TRINITY_DN3733_c0_g1_i2.p1  ORF type:complete len:1125 (-),score=163.63 TRINITY_DN3733_c0_g1_i2:30-3404(-)
MLIRNYCARMFSVSLLLLLFTLHGVVHSYNITFGQSAAFSGPSSLLGLEMRKGILASFHEVNMNGLIPPGIFGDVCSSYTDAIQLNLISYDDGYEPTSAANNTAMLLDQGVFALIGEVGTPTTNAALPLFEAENCPLIGPVTGSMSLRNPYNPLIVNLRASYVDETASMVNYLTNQMGIAKISIFYQNDSFGTSGYNALMLALNQAGLRLESNGTYERNTINVQSGLNGILRGLPQAVVMIGTYAPLALFVQLAKQTPQLQNATFLTVSFVGPEPFRDALQGNYENILVSQVVPLPTDTSYAVVKRYQVAMADYYESIGESYTSSNYTFLSLEGYMVGLLTIKALQRIEGNLTRENFLNAIYGTSIFDLGGLRLGPYGPVCQDTFTGCECNQGMHRVFLTHIDKYGKYRILPDSDFSFSTCGYSGPTHAPVVFGQTIVSSYTDFFQGDDYRKGIRAAFSEYNSQGYFPSQVVLITLSYNSDLLNATTSLTQELIQKDNVFALIGSVGTPQNIQASSTLALASSVPFIGALSGQLDIRQPFTSGDVNIRASYYDETASSVHFITKNYGITHIGIIFQNDDLGYPIYEGFSLACNANGVQPLFEIEHDITNMTGIEDDAISEIAAAKGKAIFIGISKPLIIAEFIVRAREMLGNDTFYVLASITPPELFLSHLEELYSFNASTPLSENEFNPMSNIYITQSVPSPSNTQHPLVSSYLSAMSSQSQDFVPSFASLEGYLVGKFATSALSRVDSQLSSTSYLNAIYGSGLFNVANIVLGPFDSDFDPCNQGSKQVFMMEIVSNSSKLFYQEIPSSEYQFETCGVDYSSDNVSLLITTLSPAIKNAMVSLAYISMFFGIVFLAITVYFRKRVVVLVRSEIFCYGICVGCILAQSNVVAASGLFTSSVDSAHCMLQISLMTIGYSICSSSLLANSFGTWLLFTRKVPVSEAKVHNRQVTSITLPALIVTTIILVIWSRVDPSAPTLFAGNSGYYWACSSKHSIWTILFYLYLGCLGAINIFFSLRARSYKAQIGSNQVGYAMYSIAFLAVVILPLKLLVSTDLSATFVLNSIGFIFGSTFTLLSTLGVPYYQEAFSSQNTLLRLSSSMAVIKQKKNNFMGESSEIGPPES